MGKSFGEGDQVRWYADHAGGRDCRSLQYHFVSGEKSIEGITVEEDTFLSLAHVEIVPLRRSLVPWVFQKCAEPWHVSCSF